MKPYQLAGNGTRTRNLGQTVKRVPLGIADLNSVNLDLTGGIFGKKAEHKLAGKGPRLTLEVFDIFYFDPNLLINFPMDGLFRGFTWFDEAGQRAVHLA